MYPSQASWVRLGRHWTSIQPRTGFVLSLQLCNCFPSSPSYLGLFCTQIPLFQLVAPFLGSSWTAEVMEESKSPIDVATRQHEIDKSASDVEAERKEKEKYQSQPE